MSLEQSLSAAAARAKQRGAAQFVQQLQAEAAMKGVASAVGLAPHLQPGNEPPAVSAAWLQAVAQIMQVGRAGGVARGGGGGRAGAWRGARALVVE